MFYFFCLYTANVYEYNGLYMRGHYIQRVVYSNNNRLGRAWCWVPRDVMRSTEIWWKLQDLVGEIIVAQAQSAAGTILELQNKGSRRFNNGEESPYLGLLLVESTNKHLHI